MYLNDQNKKTEKIINIDKVSMLLLINLNIISIKFVKSSNSIQIFVDILGNRYDLSIQFILNLEQILLVIISNEINCKSQMSKSSRSSNSVQIGMHVRCNIKINYHTHLLDINSTRSDIR